MKRGRGVRGLNYDQKELGSQGGWYFTKLYLDSI